MKKLLASALLAAALLLPMASRGEEPPDVVIITITIEVKQEMLPELMDAFARVFRRPEMVRNPNHDPNDPESPEMIPNPVSKGQFARQKIVDFVRDVWRVDKSRRAAEAARDNALQEAEMEVQGITAQ